MAAALGGAGVAVNDAPIPQGDPESRSVERHLFSEPFEFDFFQAVRLLERLAPQKLPVGKGARPDLEIVRFTSWQSLAFPASAVHDLVAGEVATRPAQMMTTFLGMTGSSGVLPRHYTEMIIRLEREAKGAERHALRDWLELFSHRFVSLFFRAWEKYRFFIPYERGEHRLRDPDTFTRGLLSLVGLGTAGLRDRLRVGVVTEVEGTPREKVLARIDDLSIVGFGGYFNHRPRNAVSLESLLTGFVGLTAKVVQFQGQWLRLDPGSQSVMGRLDGNNCLGRNVIVGDRIWDVQSKLRIQLGPMKYEQFLEFLPDKSPQPRRKALFLLAQFVRLYVGPELDVEFQLILAAEEVPACKVGVRGGIGTRLGWNTWSRREAMKRDADDAVFQAEETVLFRG
jgi:type VI secretion system protein ImpH